ncbi:hypothetical protein KEM48_006197 [Puccinia striiformis f. sp. tritici PST-130]|nr:hypothetical protein KEM48_006197 [Puccinia striiformis f. sp. tritici PST-130]
MSLSCYKQPSRTLNNEIKCVKPIKDHHHVARRTPHLASSGANKASNNNNSAKVAGIPVLTLQDPTPTFSLGGMSFVAI